MPDPAAIDEHGPLGAGLFPNLFTPLAVGSVTFKNRILVTGHMTMMVADGAPDDRQVAYHEACARGGGSHGRADRGVGLWRGQPRLVFSIMPVEIAMAAGSAAANERDRGGTAAWKGNLTDQ
ncbi:MAG: hypothetical protein ACTSQ7_13215 [Alphaproteobacteria bacterium]